MKTLELAIDDQLLERVQAIADIRQCSIQDLLIESLSGLSDPANSNPEDLSRDPLF